MSFFYILISIMFLARALANINTIETNVDRRLVLIQTLKNPEKLAKTELQIEFLVACRQTGITPRFIRDCIRPVRKVFEQNNKVMASCEQFGKSLLNEAISEAFRRRAFLNRERNRLFYRIRRLLDTDKFEWVRDTCIHVFEITIAENRPRLVSKYDRLKQEVHQRTLLTTAVEN